jgi:Alpha/beta hydrolase of unknown function (DUF900)
MSHYFTIPINTNGIVSDLNVASNFKNALNLSPKTTDIFIYSHGWWTSAARALSNYNQFSIELTAKVSGIAGAATCTLKNLPTSPLGIAIHWPSMIDDDDESWIDKLEALSFYTMGHRADQVGKNAVYSLLRLIIEESPSIPRLHFLGHSFGCRVVCSAIQEILNDITTIPGGNNLMINAVLLEPAFDENDLEHGEMYGDLCGMPNLRLLTTRSDLDKSLMSTYPLSQDINIFKGGGSSNGAFGGKGPTAQTIKDFGGMATLVINPGFTYSLSAVASTKLILADLTPVHKANATYPDSDHHSDIFLPEIYELICGFLFK